MTAWVVVVGVPSKGPATSAMVRDARVLAVTVPAASARSLAVTWPVGTELTVIEPEYAELVSVHWLPTAVWPAAMVR